MSAMRIDRRDFTRLSGAAEVWDSKESHAASLQLPSVREAIKRGRPLIAGFGAQTITEPVGGHGLG